MGKDSSIDDICHQIPTKSPIFHIAAQGRSSPLPSGKRGEEVCIVHVKSVEERAMKLLSNEERAPSNCLHTKEMGTFLGGDKIQCRNRPQSTIIST